MTVNSSFYQVSNATVYPSPSNLSAIAAAQRAAVQPLIDEIASAHIGVNPDSYPGADDTAKVAAAIIDAQPSPGVYLTRDFLVTSFANPRDIPFYGPGRILDALGRQYNQYTDQIRPLMSGREYFVKVPMRITDYPTTALTVTILGDSRAAKYLTTDGRNDFVATIAGTSMTVTSAGSNVFFTKGMTVTAMTGAAVPTGTAITTGPSHGGPGVYTLNNSATVSTPQTFRGAFGGGYGGTTEDQRVAGQPGDFFLNAFRAKGVQNPMFFRPRAIGGTGITFGDPMPDVNDLTGGLDLIIIDSIYNDATVGLALTLTNVENLLSAIRTSTYGGAGNLDIVIMGPHAGFDPGTHKMDKWNEELEAPLWALCKKYKCVYFRTYNLINDPEWLTGVGTLTALDHPTPSTLVHPGQAYQSLRYGRLVDELFSGTDLQLCLSKVPVPFPTWGTWVPTDVYSQGAATAQWVGGQRIRLEGAIVGGPLTVNAQIAQLPYGMSPTKTKLRNAITFDGTSGSKPCPIIIQNNGSILLNCSGASSSYINFAGIEFDRFD